MTGSPHFAVSVIDLHFATDGEEPKRVLEAGIAKSATNKQWDGGGWTDCCQTRQIRQIRRTVSAPKPTRTQLEQRACLPIHRLTHSQVVHDVDITGILFLSKKFSQRVSTVTTSGSQEVGVHGPEEGRNGSEHTPSEANQRPTRLWRRVLCVCQGEKKANTVVLENYA